MAVVLIVLAVVAFMTVVSGVYIFIIGFVRKKDVSWLIENEMKKRHLESTMNKLSGQKSGFANTTHEV